MTRTTILKYDTVDSDNELKILSFLKIDLKPMIIYKNWSYSFQDEQCSLNYKEGGSVQL